MNPFHEEQKRRAKASLISLALTIVFSLLGLYNWLEIRAFVISMLACLKVDPFSWQAVDNFAFLLAGIAWLAFVFYCQFYLKRQALQRRVLRAAALLLAVQIWLLFLCRAVPALFGDMSRLNSAAAIIEGALALLLSVYLFATTKRVRQGTSMNHGERG